MKDLYFDLYGRSKQKLHRLMQIITHISMD